MLSKLQAFSNAQNLNKNELDGIALGVSVCLTVRLSVYSPNPVVNFYQLRIKIIPLEAY